VYGDSTWTCESLCEEEEVYRGNVCIGPRNVIQLTRPDVLRAQGLDGELQFSVPYPHVPPMVMLTIADELWMVNLYGTVHVYSSQDGSFLRDVQLELGDTRDAHVPFWFPDAVVALGLLCVPLVVKEKGVHVFACFKRDGKRVTNLPITVAEHTVLRLGGCEDRLAVLDPETQSLHLFFLA
jgi:hypothetical protein